MLSPSELSEYHSEMKETISALAQPSHFAIFSLPPELLDVILSLMDYHSLLKLETTCSKFSTEKYWQKFKIQYNFDYSWEMCKEEEARSKCEFRLSLALNRYILIHQYPGKIAMNRPDLVEKIYAQYGDLDSRYPLFGFFIHQDITRFLEEEIKEVDEEETLSKIDDMDNIISKNIVTVLQERPECLDQSGDALLRGLVLVCGRMDVNSTKRAFSSAVQNGATCSSLYLNKLCTAWKNTHMQLHPELVKFNAELAIASALKGDERALFELCLSNSEFSLKLYQEGKFFFSSLLHLAKLSPLVSANYLIDLALDLALPQNTLVNHPLFKKYLGWAGKIKCQKSEYAKADMLLSQSVKLYDLQNTTNNILKNERELPSLLRLISKVKIKLHKFEEAEVHCASVLIIHENIYTSVSTTDLTFFAFIKNNLEKFVEAEKCLTQALELSKLPNKKINPNDLISLAHVKLKLNKFEEANDCLIQAEELYRDIRHSFASLIAVGHLKYELNKLDEITPYFTQALDESNEGAKAPEDIALLASLCVKLKHLEKANELYAKSLALWEDNVPEKIAKEALEAKLLLTSSFKEKLKK